jgi:hypothetical protein
LAYVAESLDTSRKPHLLVCDFTLRRVYRVWQDHVEQAYRSPRGWSPAGIWVDADGVLLLEHRINNFYNRLFDGRLIGDYVRIRHGSLTQLDSPSTLVSLSRLKAIRAEHARGETAPGVHRDAAVPAPMPPPGAP